MPGPFFGRLRAVILDRDGTLIRHVPYLHDPDQVELLPSVAESLEKLRAAGVLLFLHTNQSGVGRGYFSLEDVHACNHRMIELLDFGSEPFLRICIAPERPEAKPVYRKPSPRFALEMMEDYKLNPNQVCYVGDRASDLATASAAGTEGIGVSTGLDDLTQELTDLGLAHRFSVFPSFVNATDYLLHWVL